MKIGLYSITYLGVWYRGEPLVLEDLMRRAARQGWEGVELDTKRPHAAPMDLSARDRARLRDLAGELGLPICAVSPNSDLSSHIPEQREAMICYVRACIELPRDLGSPLCKIFAAWPGLVVRDGLAEYRFTRARSDPFPEWANEHMDNVLVSLREPRLELYRRAESGRWELLEAVAGETLEIASLQCRLSVDEVYRNPLAG
jgi:sugar phosphate isomerase/epimerase